MKDRWLALWNRLAAAGDPEPIYGDLVRRYSEPGRSYHNLRHIEHCLSEFASHPDSPPDQDAIEFALWFHDAIYDTRARDNEERSADLAREVALQANLLPSFAAAVVELILATKHTEPPDSPAGRTTVDVDLSILGQPESVFDEYERQIRDEYAWVPEQDFKVGRSAVLARFLAQERIYSTPFFHDRYEVQARANLARSLARLHTPSRLRYPVISHG